MKDSEHTRAFVVHLRDEHRRLDEVLRHIEDEWPPAKASPSIIDASFVIEGLERLRSDLTRHFAQEEQGGCLEEAACRAPKLSQEADRIEDEHAELLERLERILDCARSGASQTAGIREIEQEFRAFVRQLRAHEVAENRVLARALGADVEEFETV